MKLSSIFNKKLNGEQAEPVVEGLKTEEDTEGMEEYLTNALTNKPKKFSGTAKVYDGDVTIEMTNGDKINVVYKNSGQPGSKTHTTMTVNGKDKVTFEEDGMEWFDKIGEIYYGSKK